MKQKKNLIQRCYIYAFSVFLFNLISVHAQDIKLSGYVSDINNQPLPGVSVIIKGTHVGAVTDFDGYFELKNSGNDSILVFSYVGMKYQEVSIDGKTEFKVIMEEDIEGLDQVVVIGYGGVKKSDLTGSVASVSSEDLNKTVNQSFSEALEGRASGVQIQNGGGTPGGDISIRIRGGTSISASNEPLYVIDGFPVVVNRIIDYDPEADAQSSTNALAGIDPNDIESIQILKDASATAIYGSRGANGVVIITTKKGRVGKSVVSFETYLSSQSVTDKIDVLDAVEYATYRKAWLETQDSPNADQVAFYNNPESFASFNKDWQDEIFRNGFIRNYRLGLSGGAETIRYNVSLGAFSNKGIIKESGFDRYTARINLNGNSGDRFRYSAVMSGSFSEQTGLSTGGSNGTRQGIVSSAILSAPFDVNDFNDPLALNAIGIQNTPIDELYGGEVLNKNDFYQVNLSLEYDLSNNFTFKSLIGATIRNQKNSSFFSVDTGRGSFSGGELGGLAIISHEANRSWLNENTLTYKKEFGEHNISALIGGTIQKSLVEEFLTSTASFGVDDLGFDALDLGASVNIPFSNVEPDALVSGLSRLNYGYMDKYLFTFSYRADGSSRFAEGQKWGYFPAAAFAWKVSDEAWLEDSATINSLKLRVGYGVTGNQEVPRFRSLAALQSGFYAFGIDDGSLTTALSPERVANPNLTWETTKQVNFGVDFGLFNQRVSGTIDFYDKKTEDLLLFVNPNPSTGIGTPALTNVGSVKNTGLELALKTININTDNFSWTTDFNISFNNNEILGLGTSDEINIDVQGGWHQITNEVILKVGESVGSFYGYETDGIDANGARIFVDQNGDDVVNDDDRVIIGNALAKHFGGFTNQFSYKGFDLSVFFNWSYGNDVYNANNVYLEELDTGNNRNSSALDAWSTTNQDSDFTALGESTGASRFSDRFIEDGSYIRLKNISLGYTFGEDILNKTMFKSAKVYISGQNLWTGTDYTGYNPEANTSPLSVAPGVDWGAYPLSKIYTLGLNVTF